MNDDFESLSITTDFNGIKNNPKQAILNASNAGFEYAMWCHESDSDHIYSQKEINDIKNILKRRNIKLLDIHGSTGREKYWLAEKGDTQRKGLELIENRIKMAKELNIDTIVLHVFSEEDAKFSWVKFNSAMDYLMPILKRERVRIAFENLCEEIALDGYHPENTETLYNIFQFYDSPLIGMCLDSGHWNISGYSYGPDSQINLFKDKIFALHLSDNYGINDDHRIPFLGTVDWDGLIKFLARSSYGKRPLNFESMLKTHADEGMKAEEFLYLMKLTGDSLSKARKKTANNLKLFS